MSLPVDAMAAVAAKEKVNAREKADLGENGYGVMHMCDSHVCEAASQKF